MRSSPTMSPESARVALLVLVDALRDEGFAVSPGTACCGSCAAYELAGEAEDGTPAAYYSEQDVERGYVDVYLGFGAVNETAEERTREVGERIVEIAEREGVAVRWDGDPARRILVNPSGEEGS